MSKSIGHDVQPLVIEQVGKQLAGVYPMPNDGKIELRNDHLIYAITWFSLALIGIVMFGFYNRIKE